jgi:hypothetical protein
MCWKTSNWVMAQRLPSGEKWTLAALAHCLNHTTKQCNPGYKLLSELTGFGVSTVKMHVASLKTMGIITTKAMFTSVGDRTSNAYFFCKSATDASLVDGSVQLLDDRVVQEMDCNREYIEQRKEHTSNESSEDESDDSGVDDFEEEKPSAVKDETPYAQIVEAYHKHLPQLPRKLKITPQIKSAIKSRWKENKHHRNIAFWTQYFIDVNIFDFYAKPVPGQWKCTFDFLVTPKGFNQMIERVDDHLRRSQ